MIRRALALFGIAALAACDPVGVAQPVALLGGDLVATPPAGYCADPVSSRLRAGFAVFAPCVTLGTDAPVPQVLGVATVQAGDAGSAMVAGAETGLRDFLISPQGAGLLSKGGSGETVSVVSSQAFGGRVVVHFRDTGEPPMDGLGPDEWRAFTDVNGRLVTVSVRGLDDAPLSAGRGSALLDQMLRGLSASATVADATP
ncbi:MULTISPECIES: dihydroxy-acid dehydratase [unclassified Yoonia]|uniref:dihydroxy-acid dehydratase n=1 Tax=unclassified Yoonia TaxID=2629118 RepID=UPI002B002DEE|nr:MULTISPECIES: dihydroxy-acid dehydratase [unclassified Yoonia]